MCGKGSIMALLMGRLYCTHAWEGERCHGRHKTLLSSSGEIEHAFKSTRQEIGITPPDKQDPILLATDGQKFYLVTLTSLPVLLCNIMMVAIL